MASLLIQNTHFTFNTLFFPKIVRFLCNVKLSGTDRQATDNITRRRKDAICTPITQRQQWLRKRAWMLRFTCTVL